MQTKNYRGISMFNLKVLLVMMKYELKQAADFEKKH